MFKYTILTAIAAMTLVSCQQQEMITEDASSHQIMATIDTPADSRTAVDGAGVQGGYVAIHWSEKDQLGVFEEAGTTQKCYTNTNAGTSAAANFRATDPFKQPKYAYYPYNASNDGKSVTSLSGTLPTVQNMDDGKLNGDYKYGTYKESTSTGHSFSFTHIFSVGCMKVDASGTPLQNDKLKSIKITTKHSGNAVAIAGDFTFNAKTGEWSQSSNTTNSITMEWTKNQPYLDEVVTSHVCLFPTVKTGDTFEFEVATDHYTAKFSAPSKVDFASKYYNFPLTLKNFDNLVVADSEGKEVTMTSGNFTCAAMNVDGLPTIIQSGGPGGSGTTAIGNAINGLENGWDFFAVSEDFEYHGYLEQALTNYNMGTYRGSITTSIITGGGVADTDGLCFFWKKNGVTDAKGETMIAYDSKKGGITEGANELIKKGFRHYEVSVASGVTVDVYITHMNTYEGKGNTEESNAFVAAQLSQLRQLRDYVLAKASDNNRPAIIMGDTNMRYTRHQVYNNLIAPVRSAGYSIVDPWVKFNRNGKYPTWNTKSLMIRSKFAGDTENDIVCSDDQRGEVVDKMWYINVPGAPLQIEAASCINDVEHFTKSSAEASYSGVTAEDASGNILTNQTVSYTKYTGLADHFPVVVKFNYSLVQKKN